ncbi:MAG: hypothetical protein KGJ60_01765 [Verrucomicrobiota bacterium]|nr:hypothetical protein [Verrucomicrobiota bacterium]
MIVALLELFAVCERAGAQFLTKADFETFQPGGIASNWTDQTFGGAALSFAPETNNLHSGASCQRVTVSGINDTNGAMFYQPFQFQSGHVYSAGIWLRAASNSLVQLELRDTDHYNYDGASHIVTVGAAWQQVVINGGWQADTNAQLTVNFLSDGTNWVDDASLAEVTSNYLYAPLVNTTSTIPATLFGIHVNKLTAANNWPPIEQGILRLWDVSNIQWLGIQTNAGTWTWTHLDADTNVVETNSPNLPMIYTLGQTPAWAALTTNTLVPGTEGPGANSEPRDMNDWSNYVLVVGTRYKGVIQYYEIWNKTDYKGYYAGATQTW